MKNIKEKETSWRLKNVIKNNDTTLTNISLT